MHRFSLHHAHENTNYTLSADILQSSLVGVGTWLLFLRTYLVLTTDLLPVMSPCTSAPAAISRQAAIIIEL